MQRTLRGQLLVFILLLSTLLSACSTSTGPAAEADGGPSPSPIPTTASAPQPTQPPAPTEGPISLTDGLGRTISLDAPATRVVSLAPSNTEILFAIDAGETVVGRDEFSDFPAEAQAATNIGGGFGDLDLETIVSLEPDLVLAADLTPPEQVQALEDLGLTVYALPNPSDFEGLYANLRTAGQLTGREAQAEALVADMQARVEAVESRVAQAEERPLVFYELDATEPNAPWTAGPGNFIDTLIEMAGGRNLGASLESEWGQISLEALVAEDPEIIVLGSYTFGGVTPEQVAVREGWQGLRAVREGQVYPFDDNLVSRPGPRLVDGLEQLAKLFHPQLYE